MKNNKEINSGDNSVNVQGENVTVNQSYNGISYLDVKEIAMDVFKSNFYDLGHTVAEIVNKRAEKILDEYLEKINSINPMLIQNTEDPDIRYNIYEAQKNYARRDNEDIGNLLVEILSERTKEKNESLKNLVLNEALTVIPKLTLRQIDILSLIFIMKDTVYTVPAPIQPFINLINKMKKDIFITTNDIFHTHLQYTGCLSVSIGSVNFKQIMVNKFPQINNEEEATSRINAVPELISLQDMWDKSMLRHCSLTSVGMAIALSNIKSKTRDDWDINMWIYE